MKTAMNKGKARPSAKFADRLKIAMKRRGMTRPVDLFKALVDNGYEGKLPCTRVSGTYMSGCSTYWSCASSRDATAIARSLFADEPSLMATLYQKTWMRRLMRAVRRQYDRPCRCDGRHCAWSAAAPRVRVAPTACAQDGLTAAVHEQQPPCIPPSSAFSGTKSENVQRMDNSA